MERQRDIIMNLKALVHELKESGKVLIAEHFSDYMAPTFDGRYDIVYALVLVGYEPSSSRESIKMARSLS